MGGRAAGIWSSSIINFGQSPSNRVLRWNIFLNKNWKFEFIWAGWAVSMNFLYYRSVNSKCLLGVSNSPKKELQNSNFCPSLLGQKFFVRFLEEFKTPKSPFEIEQLQDLFSIMMVDILFFQYSFFPVLRSYAFLSKILLTNKSRKKHIFQSWQSSRPKQDLKGPNPSTQPFLSFF